MTTTGANDILESLSPASLAERVAAYAVDIAKSIYRLMMRRVERTPDVVDSEYNLANWQEVLSSKAWVNAGDLVDFLTPQDQTESLRKMDNRILRISARKYYQYRLH